MTAERGENKKIAQLPPSCRLPGRTQQDSAMETIIAGASPGSTGLWQDVGALPQLGTSWDLFGCFLLCPAPLTRGASHSRTA